MASNAQRIMQRSTSKKKRKEKKQLPGVASLDGRWGYLAIAPFTEGVNTSAKNLIVLHSKKGDKELKKFDAKNIAGRAGRFLYHYSGRVIVLQNDFMKAIESEPEGIKHKNYDLQAPKDEIDLFYSKDDFHM